MNIFKVYTYANDNIHNWEVNTFNDWLDVLVYVKNKPEAQVIELSEDGILINQF